MSAHEHRPTRRSLIRAAGGLSAAMALGAGSVLATATAASAAGDGFGLRIVDRNEGDPRMRYYRFATDAIGWDPAVNVLLPDGYHTDGRRYPVLYLLHGVARTRTSSRSTARASGRGPRAGRSSS